MTGPPRNVGCGADGSSDYFQRSAGVTDFFRWNTHASEHGEVEVGERRLVGHDDVSSRGEGAAAAAGVVPPGVTPPNAGMPAAAPANAAPGTAAAAPATGAAPNSRQALNAANVPIKSEKLGTAAPSEDVKRAQTKSVPKGAAPAVEKESSPKTANKQ